MSDCALVLPLIGWLKLRKHLHWNKMTVAEGKESCAHERDKIYVFLKQKRQGKVVLCGEHYAV